jgi:ribonucleoside-diphosphate reductase alpha chain
LFSIALFSRWLTAQGNGLATVPERERLPNRRAHELVNLSHAGFRCIAGVGRFSDGRLAEIFLNVAKTGTDMDASARDSAILASLLLQHGVALQTIRHALLRNSDGSAAGPLGALLDMLGD